MIKWQVNVWAEKVSKEFVEPVTAKVFAQRFDEAELIKWYVEPNLPGLKPDLVYKSLALYQWDGKARKWQGVYIHGPYGGTYEEGPSDER